MQIQYKMVQAKETYYRGQRDLLQRQKRPTIEAKETYYRGKRDLLQKQKRPTIEAKETYYRGKKQLATGYLDIVQNGVCLHLKIRYRIKWCFRYSIKWFKKLKKKTPFFKMVFQIQYKIQIWHKMVQGVYVYI